ncbi:SNF2 family N-terminal domain-containing protein [Xylariaceae sp. FL0804]|nr:SNF2 family N-terminal domain-containing protein [Xylariaceae sp. FL0804]
MASNSSSSEDELARTSPSHPTPATTASPAPSQIEQHRAKTKMASASTLTEQQMQTEESKARAENAKAEARRLAQRRKRKKVDIPPAERAKKMNELEELLRKSNIFSEILTQKTQALGRVGRDFNNETLAAAGLTFKEQPKIMTGGTMRDYQLEGLSWMYEICLQGLSGILADEMGLGKTIQVISLVAFLREQEGYLGPHLIIAPLSTVSNWQDEFQKWTPSIPFVLYHGKISERRQIMRDKIMKHYPKGRPNERFPVVVTSYEMVLRDHAALGKIDWSFIVVDEGHRMKNADAKLFRELQQFKSATRLLITGTPLQNNLKELWSLLHFLMPATFFDFEAFEMYFDFDDLQDEEGTTQFIEDEKSHALVKKIHSILQPLVLRRIKADVANYLPKKREYVLYAPMTKEQTELYNVISDKKVDTRAFLEKKVTDRLNGAANSSSGSQRSSSLSSRAPSAHPAESAPSPPTKNAFSAMMAKKKSTTSAKKAAIPVIPTEGTMKRKASPTSETSVSKSTKSSRTSTPAQSTTARSTPLSSTRSHGRTKNMRSSYQIADDSDDDKLDDDAFEAKLARELEAKAYNPADEVQDDVEIERAASLEMAKLQIGDKKLGNALMQLRLVCNSPHNIYNPWAYSTSVPVDESIVTASGKMLLLDRLLPELFQRGHKVLIFSQFKTQLDILHDYCADLRGWNVCRLDGSVAQDERRRQIKEFNENPNFKIFLLSTRAGGQGINLASADTVVIFDSDWNPQQDLQAQDRCHRIGQTRPVVVYRLATKGTVEEQLLLSADAKRRLEKLVIRKGGLQTMAQRIHDDDGDAALDRETLEALLLKDGEVYKHAGGDQIFTDEDLDTLCDRSDEAFDRAASGAGNAAGFQVVETGADGITQMNG